MGEFAVDGTAYHYGVALFELLELFLESQDLGGAYEGEIEGVKEKDDMLFPDVLCEGELFYKFTTVDHCIGFK
jgi:hypothetical protein